MRHILSVLLLMSGLLAAGGATSGVLLDNTTNGTAQLASTGYSSGGGRYWGWSLITGPQDTKVTSVEVGYDSSSSGAGTITFEIYPNPPGQMPIYAETVNLNYSIGSQYYTFSPSSLWMLSANTNYLLVYSTSNITSSAKTNPQNTNFSSTYGFQVTNMVLYNSSTTSWNTNAANSTFISALNLEGEVYQPGPPTPSQPIPTLTKWAQIMMMLVMLATAGLYGWRMKQG